MDPLSRGIRVTIFELATPWRRDTPGDYVVSPQVARYPCYCKVTNVGPGYLLVTLFLFYFYLYYVNFSYLNFLIGYFLALILLVVRRKKFWSNSFLVVDIFRIPQGWIELTMVGIVRRRLT